MILVTGGTGFVGQRLIQHLVQAGKPVRTLLRPSHKSPNLPIGVPVEVAVTSLRDERGLRAALKDVEVIVHLAGGERQGSRSDLELTDVEGAKMLADAARLASVRRIVYLSHLGADRASAYSVMKAKAIAEGYLQRSGVETKILRSAVVFGPKDQFTTSLVRLLKLSPFIFMMPGDGHSLLQPIWLEDLIACIQMVIDDPSKDNQVIAIGGGEYLTFREVLETVMQVSKVRRRIQPFSPVALRYFSLMVEQLFPWFPISIFWLDYLAADHTCALDTLPRQFGLIPARFTQQLDYLAPAG